MRRSLPAAPACLKRAHLRGGPVERRDDDAGRALVERRFSAERTTGPTVTPTGRSPESRERGRRPARPARGHGAACAPTGRSAPPLPLAAPALPEYGARDV